MTPELLIEDLAGVGVELWKDGDKLRCRGPRRALTPELVEGLRQHKAEILERLEGDGARKVARRRATLSPATHSNTSPIIQDAGEVLELAHAHFGELEHPEDPPYPPPEGNGDPLVHRHTPKAQFFQGVRRRDRERREREGLPPWIRVVDGGAA